MTQNTSSRPEMPQARGHHSRLEKIIYVVILGMLTAFGPVCTDIYLPALPAMGHDFEADPSLTQLSLTATFLGLALGQLIIGPLSDALGRRRPLLVSLLVFTLASLLCATAPSIYWLIFWRFFQGLAGAGGMVLSRSMAADTFSGAKLASFVGLLMTVNSVAPILGPMLGSALVTLGSWQLVFYTLALWGLLLVVVSHFKIDETHHTASGQGQLKKALADMGHELLNRRLMWYVVALSFVSGALFGYISASPFVFQVIYGLNPGQYGLVFGCIALCMSVCGLVAGVGVRLIGEWRLTLASLFLLLVIGLLLLVWAGLHPPVWVVLVTLMVMGGVTATANTAGFNLVMGARRGGVGAANGILGVMNFLFGALVSPLMGVMGEHSMVPLGLCVTLSGILGLGFFLTAGRGGGRAISVDTPPAAADAEAAIAKAADD